MELPTIIAPARKNAHKESHIQQVSIRWFRYQYPQYNLLLFAIPNEGVRTQRNGARLKAQGLQAGCADLFFSVAKGGYHGLYIEFKADKNKQTESQKLFEQAVVSSGYRYSLCYSLDEFINVINGYLK